MAHVLFDLGGVLVDFDHRQAIRQVAQLCDVGTDRLHEIIFEQGLEEQYDTGRIDSAKFAEELRLRAGFRGDLAALESAWSEIFRPKEDVLRLLGELDERGVPLGLVSNTNPAHWTYIAALVPRLDRFRWRFLSFEMRVRKPAPAYYQRVADGIGEAPASGWFIDDRVENLAPAVRMGWRTIHFQSAEQLRNTLNESWP